LALIAGRKREEEKRAGNISLTRKKESAVSFPKKRERRGKKRSEDHIKTRERKEGGGVLRVRITFPTHPKKRKGRRKKKKKGVVCVPEL